MNKIDRDIHNLATNVQAVIDTTFKLAEFGQKNDLHPLVLATAMKWFYEKTLEYLAMDMRTNKTLREMLKHELPDELDNTYIENREHIRQAIDTMVRITDKFLTKSDMK